jgi:hypothetical protein
LIRSKAEFIRFVGGQCRIVLLQSRSRPFTGVAAVSNLPAHVATILQQRWFYSVDACGLHGRKEARRIGVRDRVGAQSHRRQDSQDSQDSQANYTHPFLLSPNIFCAGTG